MSRHARIVEALVLVVLVNAVLACAAARGLDEKTPGARDPDGVSAELALVRRDGRWQLVARHITEVPRPAP